MATALVGARQIPEHGQHIFIYSNLATNQVVYSLSRAMNNNAAMKQLPFLGKKTKPASLRKDHWRPLATVTFPSGPQGLEAYRHLREFRKRHEHEWSFPDEHKMTRLERGRRVMDQKANTIADLAAVLFKQEKLAEIHEAEDKARREELETAEKQARDRVAELRVKRLEKYKMRDQNPDAFKEFKAMKTEKVRLSRALRKGDAVRAMTGRIDPLNDRRIPAKRGPGRLRGVSRSPRMSTNGISIKWSNILDAEFAANWPQSVLHDSMEERTWRNRNVHPDPSAAPAVPSRAEAGEAESASMAQGVEAVVSEPSKRLSQPESEEPTTLRRVLNRLQFGRQS